MLEQISFLSVVAATVCWVETPLVDVVWSTVVLLHSGMIIREVVAPFSATPVDAVLSSIVPFSADVVSVVVPISPVVFPVDSKRKELEHNARVEIRVVVCIVEPGAVVIADDNISVVSCVDTEVVVVVLSGVDCSVVGLRVVDNTVEGTVVSTVVVCSVVENTVEGNVVSTVVVCSVVVENTVEGTVVSTVVVRSVVVDNIVEGTVVCIVVVTSVVCCVVDNSVVITVVSTVVSTGIETSHIAP